MMVIVVLRRVKLATIVINGSGDYGHDDDGGDGDDDGGGGKGW